jgi:hypothetical protein
MGVQFVGFKEAYDSVRREVLYSILIEFGMPMSSCYLLAKLVPMFADGVVSCSRCGRSPPVVISVFLNRAATFSLK